MKVELSEAVVLDEVTSHGFLAGADAWILVSTRN